MGSHQENWFYNQLSDSAGRGATWRIIGSQIVFAQITESSGVSGDNWSVRHLLPALSLFKRTKSIADTSVVFQGYTANRNRTLKHLYDNNIGNNVFLAGDSHQNWVSSFTTISPPFSLLRINYLRARQAKINEPSRSQI